MKHHPVRLALASALCGVAAFLPATTRPSDEGVPLSIDVRSKVEAKWEGFRKLATVAHGKLYLLATVSEVEVADKLVKPLDRAALATHLRREMAAKGFREITGGETPEIVLTVVFGRGYLRNPHLDGAAEEMSPEGLPQVSINSAKQAMRQRQPGFERKRQSAQAEKLYIAVTAWQYPPVKGQKPNQLWRTVMVTDNPDTRDLNLAMPAMLAAGVGYFDRDIKDDEVTINSTMPTGTVKLGPLNVLEEKTGK
jgi:hypothetical protein